MPIYEYECESCNHEFEALQKISAAKLTDCPECKESALRKKISAAAFRLKGGGWYETDFKTGDKKNVAGDKPAEGKAKTSSEGGDKGKKSSEGSAKPSSDSKSTTSASASSSKSSNS